MSGLKNEASLIKSIETRHWPAPVDTRALTEWYDVKKCVQLRRFLLTQSLPQTPRRMLVVAASAFSEISFNRTTKTHVLSSSSKRWKISLHEAHADTFTIFGYLPGANILRQDVR